MTEDLQQLMEEGPVGDNHGRTAEILRVDSTHRRHVPLDVEAHQRAELMRERGWDIVTTRPFAAGMVAHRGVLHPDEYVDGAELQRLVEEELGYSYEQVRSVYRQGPLTEAKRELRALIDARLLALLRSGGNMAELGRSLGFPVKHNGSCDVIDRALARAREAS